MQDMEPQETSVEPVTALVNVKRGPYGKGKSRPPKGTCSICFHPRAADVARALLQGRSIRSVAEEYAIDRTSLERHFKRHIPHQFRAAATRLANQSAAKVLDELIDLKDRCLRLLSTAEESKNNRLQLAAIREIRGLLETIGKGTGELQAGQTTTNIQVNLGVPVEEARAAVDKVKLAASLSDEDAAHSAIEYLRDFLRGNPDQDVRRALERLGAQYPPDLEQG